MANENENEGGSSAAEAERIKNLQAEFARKLDEQQKGFNEKFEAMMQKMDALTVKEEPAIKEPVSVNEKEELLKISAGPRRYVEQFTKPLEEKASLLEKELLEQRKATLTSQWERLEDRIARAEGKRDWKELPEEMRKEIRQEIVSRGWAQNPSYGMDAYDIVRARRVNTNHSDPDRLNRIRQSQTEGSGQRSASGAGARSITASMLDEISSTPPSHPDYKRNMETLDKVQKGYVKVEG